jgi:hypothetical protein
MNGQCRAFRIAECIDISPSLNSQALAAELSKKFGLPWTFFASPERFVSGILDAKRYSEELFPADSGMTADEEGSPKKENRDRRRFAA